MQIIQKDLKELIDETMIPETLDFIEELEVLKRDNKATSDDLEAIEEMKVFLEELESIVSAIEANELSNEDAQDIFNKIESMISEHNEH